MTVWLVHTLKAGGVSQRRALALAGMARSSWHYLARPRPAASHPVPHSQRRTSAWLRARERAAIESKLTVQFAAGRSVHHAFYSALDAGDPIASISSWYRIARGLEGTRPARRRANHRSSAIPSLVATAPMQVWSWDITKLKGLYRGQTYELYVVIDVFSRMITAWRLEEHEDDELAKQMFQNAFSRMGARPNVVHSDGGSSMKSKTLTGLFGELGVQVSRNRPRVSNDNPYSESLFKTAKYAPSYPHHFTSLEHARGWAETFISWYNREHYHSALEGHTPASVHHGTWIDVHHQRAATMTALYAEHPSRFTRPPQIRTPMAHVAINHEINSDRLQTG